MKANNVSMAISLRDQMSATLQRIDQRVVSLTENLEELRAAVPQAPNLAGATSAADKMKDSIGQAAQNSGKLKDKLYAAENPLNNLITRAKQLAITLGLAKAGKAMIDMSDKLTQVNARLRLISDSEAEVLALNNKIFAAAERGRGSYLQMSDSVAKLGMQARNAFKSNDEIIAFSEQLNKIFTVSGTDSTGVESVMYNLTQAMSSGILRGQDLNSVLSNAPGIARMIEKQMGATEGSIRKLAEQGLVSASVVKEAILSNAAETDRQFESMPQTMQQVATSIQNNAIVAFAPVGKALNQIFNSARFKTFTEIIINNLRQIGEVLLTVLNVVITLVNGFNEHFSSMLPVIAGVVAMIATYNSAIVIAAAVTKAKEVATRLATVAQWLFNASLQANPLMWVVGLIGLVVTALVAWVQHVGGVRRAWQILCDNVALGAVHLMNSFREIKQFFQISFLGISAAWSMFWDAVATTAENMAVSIMKTVENLINSVIAGVNKLISAINSIGIISIDTISNVKFATEAEATAKAWQASRAEKIQSKMGEVEATLAAREQDRAAYANTISTIKAEFADRDFRSRLETTEAQRNAALNRQGQMGEQSGFYSPPQGLQEDVNAIKGNTGSMADSLDSSEEELVYLRDIAERDAINRYTTSQLTVEYNAHNTINNGWDADRVFDEFSERLNEASLVAAEGVG